MNPSPNTPKEEKLESESLELITQIIRLLDRNLRSRKLYSANNPTLLKHQSELFSFFEKYFETREDLTLSVEPFELRIEEVSVYQNDNQKESFAFRLFNDGIRSLSFLRGVSEIELQEFLSAVSASEQESGSDSVTLLWEKEFEHIQYVVADAISEEPSSDQRSMEERVDDLLDPSKSKYQIVPPPPQEDIYKDFKVTLDTTNIGAMFKDRSVLSPQELEKIHEDLLQSEKPEQLTLDFINMVLAVLQEETKVEDFDKVVESLGGALDHCLLQGQFHIANLIMHHVSQFPTHPARLAKTDPQLLPRVKKILWPTRRLDLLLVSINQEKIGSMEEIEKLLPQMDPSSLPHLLLHVKNIVDPHRRKQVCKGLSKLHQGDFGIFLPLLSSKDLETIRTGLQLLSEIKNEKVVDLLPGLIQHENLTIRKEAISVLRSFPTPKAFRILINLLKDPMEEIRIVALRVLATSSNRDVAKTLAQVIQSPLFPKWSMTERKAYFFTIAKIMGDDFVPYLKKLLTTNNWFGRQDIKDSYQCAIFALTAINTSLSKSLMEQLSRTGNKTVRILSETALRYLEKHPS